MSIGFLAELIIAYQARDADTYSIAERTQPVLADSASAETAPARRQPAGAKRSESTAP